MSGGGRKMRNPSSSLRLLCGTVSGKIKDIDIKVVSYT